jgi:regulatory protein
VTDSGDIGIDAEAWLRDRGVAREELKAAPPVPPDSDERTPVSAREAARLASELPSPTSEPEPPVDPVDEVVRETLSDEVAKATAYVRRATANTPMSEGRLRDRLAKREFSMPAIDLALERARKERLVDDAALALALAEQAVTKGHAPTRIAHDLRKRELPNDVIEAALSAATPTDLEAAAFAVATSRARASQGVEPEAAFRRVMGHLARRGYPEALARRVARQAVFEDRDADRIAGR